MEKFDVFISYNWKSKLEVENLYKDITEKLNLRVWLDRNEINGSLIYDIISAGIRMSDIFLCCITRDYCDSKNCRMEIEYARYLKKEIVVLMLQKLNMEEIKGIGMIINPYSRINCYDFSDTWADKCFERISKAITESLKNTKSFKDQDYSMLDQADTKNDYISSEATNVPTITLNHYSSIHEAKTYLISNEAKNIPVINLDKEKSIPNQAETKNVENNVLISHINPVEKDLFNEYNSKFIYQSDQYGYRDSIESIDTTSSNDPTKSNSVRLKKSNVSSDFVPKKFPGFLGSIKSLTASLNISRPKRTPVKKSSLSDEGIYKVDSHHQIESLQSIEMKNKVKEIKKYEKIMGSSFEFENIIKIKGNKLKFNLIKKLEEHFKEKGFEIALIRELLRNIDERNWPSPIRSDSLRIKNKPIIETYKCK